MRFKELANIIEIKETNVNNDTYFDFFRTHRFEKEETIYKNMLYFLSYSTKEEEENEWCNHFDLRKKANNIINNVPNATFVIEKEQKNSLLTSSKFIVVENIRYAIDHLFKHKMQRNKAQIIGVTGSVGKTTCVGLIEHLIKNKYNILRIYSSRITPLVLKGYILNYLNDDIQIIVMEYSIYAKNHVEDLVDILSPNIAVVLNITTEHLGKQGLETYEDIIEGKLKIFKNSKINFLPQTFSKYASNYQNIQYFDILNFDKKKDFFKFQDIFFKPFLDTNLSIHQYIVAIKIAIELGFVKEEIQERINNFTTVEHRFLVFEMYNKSIIFLGETIHNSRLTSLADNNAKNKVLIIRKIGAKSTFTDKNSLLDSINKFGEVFVFNDIGEDYVEALSLLKNVKLVSNHSFVENIIDKVILYIYSGYFNTFSKLLTENLIDYDNTYKIRGLKK